MKLRIKLALLILSMVIFVLLGLASLIYWEKKQADIILKDRMEVESVSFDRNQALLASSMRRLTDDYTFWDEMVDFVSSGGKDWAETNLESTLSVYEVDGAWVFRPDRSLVYFAGDNKAGSGQAGIGVPFTKGVYNSLRKKRFQHFFINTNRGVMEVYAATIHPTDDPRRRTPPQGYFFTGRIWDQKYLNQLRDLSESLISVKFLQKPDSSPQRPSANDPPLIKTLPGWNGAPVARILLEERFPLIERYRKATVRSVIYLLLAGAGLVTVLAFALGRWVTGPLNELSRSIASADPDSLNNFRGGSIEFTNLATLVKNFFAQNHRLNREIKEHKQSEALATQREQRFRAIADSANDAIISIDADSKIVFWNRAARRMFGFSSDEMMNQNLTTLMPERYRSKHVNGIARYLKNGATRIIGKTSEFEALRKDGSTFPVELSVATWEMDGQVFFTGMVRSITERKLFEKELKESEEQTRIMFKHAPDAYFMYSLEGILADINIAAEYMFGYKGEELFGKNILRLPLFASKNRVETAKMLRRNRHGRATGPDEFTIMRKDDMRLIAEVRTYPVKIRGRDLVLAIARNITERKRTEEMMGKIAHRDPLTDLPNRRLLEDRISLALAQADRQKSKTAVLFVDLDFFKKINDRYGHEIGDLLLKSVSERLTGLMRRGDTVARLGGDEFVVVLPLIQRPEDAVTAARKILEQLSVPFSLDGDLVHTAASIGISIYPTDARSIKKLLRHADFAMYHAKQTGRNRFQAYGSLPSEKKMAA